jgi:thiosulfate/3-mercaptopyruvate sulfurtransferase
MHRIGMLALATLFVALGSRLAGASSQAPDSKKASVQPPSSRAALLTFADLRGRLDDPDLRIFDARPRAHSEAGHIPGAVHVDTEALEKHAAQPGALDDSNGWSQRIAPLGIGPESEIVVYDADRQLSAARVWWILTYLGAKNVALVDGGFPLWEKEGHPVSTAPANVGPSTLAIQLQPERHASREDVLKAHSGQGTQILDARSAEEFTGQAKRSRRSGHIPRACHLEWKELVAVDGRFLEPDALRTKLQLSGIKPASPVITHCQGGGRSSVNAFVLERLGHPARNYYLGWSDWGNADDTPID